ncbi:hypothetical protein Nmel_000237 [Mimus melanotis]
MISLCLSVSPPFSIPKLYSIQFQ